MNSSLLIYSVCLFLLVLLTLGIVYQAFFDLQKRGSRLLGFLVLAMADWGLFYFLELVLPSYPLRYLPEKCCISA